ncbi:hypothetical protein ACFL2H_09185 [Planctomycetota bacterium]
MPIYENLPAESKHFNGKLFQMMVDDLRQAKRNEQSTVTCELCENGWLLRDGSRATR